MKEISEDQKDKRLRDISLEMQAISYMRKKHEGILLELSSRFTDLWKEKEAIERTRVKPTKVRGDNRKKTPSTTSLPNLDSLTDEQAAELLKRLQERRNG